MFGGLNFCGAHLTKDIVRVVSLVRVFLKRPVCSFGDVKIESFDFWFYVRSEN